MSLTTPRVSGGWDCHAHLFGPYAHYPLAGERSYTPPEATQAQYGDLLARLGLSHGVLVHASAYGDDHSLVLDALARHPNWRGILVMQQHRRDPLAGLRDRGVRGLRFSHRSTGANFLGSASFDDLVALAPAMREAGLHAELWTDVACIRDIAARIRQLPVPVVIDHMGMFDCRAGVHEAGFQCLVELLGEGAVWVKLCAYRNLPSGEEMDLGMRFHRALVQANHDQVVWGTDWPHLRIAPAPDTQDLLRKFDTWTADAALVQQILVDNPQRLYG